MTESNINAAMFKNMVVSAANYLEHNKQLLNDLNVFPVPDGDTGTNMFLTIVSAVKEVTATQSDKVGALAKAMGNGALKGARGNSGVILSQIFRGFAQSVSPDKAELTAEDFGLAIRKGVESAYKAVMKPKEGTILTVARGMAEEAERQLEAKADLRTLLAAVIQEGQVVLNKTPEMLPVLKEAGVVDAGGAGLITIYKGFQMALNSEEVIDTLDLSKPIAVAEGPASSRSDISTADIQFMYCTEFFITNLKKAADDAVIDALRNRLMEIGDSIVVVGDPALIKVHVHTNTPDQALNYALSLGELSRIKIENMKEQHNSITGLGEAPQAEISKPKKPIAIVAVCAGEGLGAILKDYNVDELVSGGQSMNPSAEDIRKAVDAAPSDHVIVLPNNKNIILAAEQANDLTEKNIYVIPSKSFPQGLSAVLAFVEGASIEENIENMTEALGSVKSAQITTAVRNSKVVGQDFEVLEGEYIGLLENDIVSHGEDSESAMQALLTQMVTEDDSIISLYYGENINETAAQAISAKLEEHYPDLDVETYAGGQPVYDYIISVE